MADWLSVQFKMPITDARVLCRPLFNCILSTASKTLLQGKNVVFQNVGTLSTYVRKGRKLHLPGEAQARSIPDRLQVRFVLSPTMKKKLRKVDFTLCK